MSLLKDHMPKEATANCPCGFSVTTPFGEDEAVEIISNHAVRQHPDDYPSKPSREDALKYVTIKE
jgi:hypothetical protein